MKKSADVDGHSSETSADVKKFLKIRPATGASINAVDHYGQTPLHYATLKGNVDALGILLNCDDVDLEVVYNIIY